MTDDTIKSASLEQVGKTLTTWIGIIGAIFGVLSFCIILGMSLGPMKDVPAKLDNIIAQQSEAKYITKAIETKQNSADIQLTNTINELRQLKDDLRKTELTLAQLGTSVVLKVDFVEWKAELERQASIRVPALKKSP